MALSDAKIKALKRSNKLQKHYDERGLLLVVYPSGKKVFKFKYRIHGKEQQLTLGEYPGVGLKEARVRRDQARTLLADGKDPAVEKKHAAITAMMSARSTFGAVAEEYLQKAETEGRAEARGISFYGYEIIRPLIWIGWLWLLFSVIYLFVFFAEQPNSRALEWSISFSRIPDALSLSIGRLTPFIPWDDKSMDVKGTFNYVVRHADGANGLIVHMSAIAQTLISTGLLFLSGLAARRRFKLSD